MYNKEALLLAGGKGLRAGGEIPKQFQSVCGRPLLWWSLRAFHDLSPEIGLTVVINPDYLEFWNSILLELPAEERFSHNLVLGGGERSDSVAEGIKFLKQKWNHESSDVLVAIHDGARPLIDGKMIERGFETAAIAGSAVPVCPVTDSLRVLTSANNIYEGSTPADRTKFVAVQTPQIFSLNLLCEAYAGRAGKTLTDDASLVEIVTGRSVTLYSGNPSNIKVTHPADFILAESLLRDRK